MNWEDRIEIRNDVLGGKPVIKGTRVPVEVIVGVLAGGSSVADAALDYRIGEEDVRAALAYAALVLSEGRVIAIPNR
jgi:uncharacterized protein (DUF433 family)